ncbi:helix-turn-helix transcriptional regulator [uncultured Duncaniella sp.]|jgi:transcriptional regulator with XRE-family HTH domain|uniref:helix-turn-helix domain-containing protein n=1 Tax=Duncaniella dubosii TaxID=2518971 RepID=UPI0025AF4109|nr:helix-turn-helix transcriptional regulator [uncultured Duncaniella sp.]
MDLVSRLKRYLDSKQISVTQFADECAIPRPTGSQLLAGRNKKVSDEIISKIHLAYPDLNIVWLMFGEGNMVNNANIEISESQNTAKTESYSNDSPDTQTIDFTLDFNENLQDEVSEKKSEPTSTNTFTFASPADSPAEPLEFTQAISDETEAAKPTPPLPKSSGKGKRVTGIVVYYDDCTYESFIPDPNHGHPFMR